MCVATFSTVCQHTLNTFPQIRGFSFTEGHLFFVTKIEFYYKTQMIVQYFEVLMKNCKLSLDADIYIAITGKTGGKKLKTI